MAIDASHPHVSAMLEADLLMKTPEVIHKCLWFDKLQTSTSVWDNPRSLRRNRIAGIAFREQRQWGGLPELVRPTGVGSFALPCLGHGVPPELAAACRSRPPVHEQGEEVGRADGAVVVEVSGAASCMAGKWGSSNVAATYIRSAMPAVT